MGPLQLLGLDAAIVALCFTGLWLISLKLRDVSFVDSWWAFGIALLALVDLFSGPVTPHKLALTAICVIWGVRLGGYVFLRWRRSGPERRYQEMLQDAEKRRGWSFGLAALLIVFALQAPLQLIVALPVELGQAAPDPAPLGPIALAGVALALFGIGFEAIGDAQLAAFKADPASKGQVMDRGLWRYTRHPNYFGEACLWIGLYLIAAGTRFGAWSLPGPVVILVLLTRVSGAPTVEPHMRESRPGYAEYVRRTSGFIPWFPKA